MVEEDEEAFEAWFRLAEAMASAGDKDGAVDTLLVAQRLVLKKMSEVSGRDLVAAQAAAMAGSSSGVSVHAAGGVAVDEAARRVQAEDAVAASVAQMDVSGLPGAAAIGEEAAEALVELHTALRVMNTMGNAVVTGTWARPPPPIGDPGSTDIAV